MGIFSWLSSCGSTDDEPPSLVKSNYDNPDLDEVQQAAADAVARLQQDDKYFGGSGPHEI